MATVGVLGTGRMGTAMARALRDAGHEIVLWNRSGASAATCANDLGGSTAIVGRPADVAARAEVCISMLADGAAVDAVYGGPDGLVAGARPANILVDCSTVPPATIRAHEAAARASGAGILDAPVSGSVALASTGRLTLMVGGDAADLDRARPVLEALATTIVHLGPLGTGAAMKLAVNTVIFGLNQALAEGLVLAEGAGIRRDLAYDVIASGAAGAPYVGYKRAAFVDPDGTPVAFSLDLAAKDLGLIAELAEAVGLEMPQAVIDLAVIRAASAGGRGGRDFSAVADQLRESRQKEGSRR
jgi:3-hydroxyisobutyrate dehydrogenase-like beta-hydroxyacid dehydrogenase